MKLTIILPALLVAGSFVAAPVLARGHGPGGGMFKKLDANGDGQVTLAEARTAATSRFTSMDTNKDSVVTLAEVKEHKKAHKGEHASAEEHMQKRFERQDTNKNGQLERSETRMPAERFDKIDQNSDGALTKEELKDAWENFKKSDKGQRAEGKRGSRGQSFFAKMDANGDGQLTESEALAAVDARFAKKDANGDKVITQEELKSAREGHATCGEGDGAEKSRPGKRTRR